jgi:hypothetical protein
MVYPETFEVNQERNEEEPTWLNTVKVLSIKDGDAIVIKSPDFLSEDQVEFISSTIKKQFPNNGILIIEGGMDIGVLKREIS